MARLPFLDHPTHMDLARSLRLLIAASCLSSTLAAQTDWETDLVVPKPRAVHTMAYDTVRNEIVLFGGNTNSGGQGDTWVWSISQGWRHVQPVSSPSARREHGMAYDPLRQRVVMFGGVDRNGTLLNDTWTWDGSNWTQLTTSASPTARATEMAWDPNSQRVLVFGGQDSNGRVNDTWTFDGSTWISMTPTNAPSPRTDHALATDPLGKRVVLFGGWSNGFFNDTWVWDGSNWTQLAITGPSARSEARMDFDGQQLVLFSGDTGSGRPADTWLLSQNTWTQANANPSPIGMEEHELVHAPILGGVFLFGGWAPVVGHLADPWVFGKNGWQRLGKDFPPGTGTHAMAVDPGTGQALFFGGYQDAQRNGETWSYQNGSWTMLNPAARPAVRVESAMAFDPVRDEFVLFSGVNGTSHYQDTWVFKNGNWTQKTTTTAPAARWGHGMVFDPKRGTVVLFGGRQAGTNTDLNDTWEWNGSAWTPLNTVQSPGGRHDFGICYDSTRERVLVFGGWSGGFANDTWELANGAWNQLSLTSAPSARSELTMAYDAHRDRVVVFAGQDGSGRVNDTWEFDGTAWQQRQPKSAPEPREEHAMIFDPLAGRCVMFGGWDVGHFTDTWTYGPDDPARADSYGSGCGGTASSPAELSASLPWLGGSAELVVRGPLSSNNALILIGVTKLNVGLNIMGMPGCTLLVDPLLVIGVAPSGNTARLPYQLPTTASLVGAQALAQGAIEQAGVNPLGLLATQGVELVAGQK